MTLTALTNSDSIKIARASVSPSARDLCFFLADYSSWLLGSGATCIRMEKNMKRIASSYGMDVETTIMPRHIHMTVWRPGTDERFTYIAGVSHCGIDFSINTSLSELSWEIADGRADFASAKVKFQKIISEPRSNPWLVLLLVTIANASFCLLFGGDFVAMGVVAIATFAGFFLKQRMMARKIDVRVIVMVCAFVSSVLGATAMLFSLGSTPSIAIATSVLYLVPGIPFLNSFSDMLYRHYICAYSRMVDTLVLTACLSIGLCCGMLLMNANIF